MKQIEIPYNFDPSTRPFQAKIWNDKRKNKLLVIPRRHGKTSLGINHLIKEAICNPNKVYWYLCPTQRQAKEVVWKAPDMLNLYLPTEAVEKKNEVELTIYLKNGSQICIKGGDDPDSLRGTNPYGVIIDEYAQIKKEIYDELLMPIIKANGGWIWLIGTPKGKNDFYSKYVRASSLPDWQVMHLRASQTGVLSQQILDDARRDMTEKAYNQEFECEFLEGAGNIFRRVEENATAQASDPLDGRYQIGVDLARHEDFTVISVMSVNTRKQVYLDRFNQIDWNLQMARIEAIARRYNNATVNIDSTGVGDPITLELKQRGLDVVAFTLTNSSKSAIIQNLALQLEQDKIKILPDEVQITELQNYTFETTKHGNITYGAPSGQHDDCFVKGTKILTSQGQKNIEDVKIGDLVMTRQGLQPVINTRNKFKKVIKRLGLIGTPDHPVITTKGEIALQNVSAKDSIYIWNEKLSSIETRSITDTLIRQGVSCEYISGDMTNGSLRQLLCTDKYGLMSMGKFLKGILSITKTLTRSIMNYVILSVCPRASMQASIYLPLKDEHNQLKQEKKILKKQSLQETFGERQKKEKQNLEQECIKVFTMQSLALQFVNFVKSSFLIHVKSVVTFVKNFVMRVFTGKQRVYNLQIANQPEYFANNILVHNCVIGLALAVYNLPEKPVTIGGYKTEEYSLSYNEFGEPIY